jgi:hypothetical protein
MANCNMSVSDVKSICNDLEKSPSSSNSKSSPIKSGGSSATSGKKTASLKAPKGAKK